jgi:hypothetical protein
MCLEDLASMQNVGDEEHANIFLFKCNFVEFFLIVPK